MIILNCKKHDTEDKYKESNDTCKILCSKRTFPELEYRRCMNEYCKYYINLLESEGK